LGTYNQEKFVKEAIIGALAQTYSPLEIIISDDCSQDNTFQIIQNMVQDYSGPHRLRVNRNHVNLGVTQHLNRVVDMSSGQLIVLAAGDDISLPDRVAETYKCWEADGKKALALFTQANYLDYKGIVHGQVLSRVTPEMLTVDWMIRNAPIAHGFGLVLNRRLFDIFGPLPDDILREDVVLPVRAAILEPLKYIEMPLVYYRRHNQNLSRVPGVDIFKKNDFFTYLRRHSRGHIGICRTWIDDLNTAETFAPERKKELHRIRQIAEAKLLKTMLEDQLIDATSIQRLKILVEAYRCNIGMQKVMEWIFIYNFPRLYLKYKSFRRRGLAKTSGALIE
jgi:glycosyltransferase involved in cell wall biosynthesis